jgi:hypothetical protein
MPCERLRPLLGLVILQIFCSLILKERTLLLGWSAIASLGRLSLLSGQHYLGDRFGDLPTTPSIALATGLKIVVPTLPIM